MANVLYIGDSSPATSSAARANALVRLGHTIKLADPYKAFARQFNSSWLGPIHFHSGYRLLNKSMVGWTEQIVSENHPDMVWVNSGELLGPESLQLLKTFSCPLFLYNNDDPTGGRDARRFDLLLKALPYYDLCAVMRQVNVAEFLAKGAKRVLRVFMSYDEEINRPFDDPSDIPDEYRSEVAFIGTWMRYEKRDEFVLALIEEGIPVSIWGDRWEKSPYFTKLRPFWRGKALSGRNYTAALQGAKICLGLLSKGNRDMYTMRSLETTFSGGLLCAERTAEHQQMYKDGIEAVFWSDVKECARICKQLLAKENQREAIRLAGMRRVRSLKLGNEDVCKYLLDSILVPNQQIYPTIQLLQEAR